MMPERPFSRRFAGHLRDNIVGAAKLLGAVALGLVALACAAVVLMAPMFLLSLNRYGVPVPPEGGLRAIVLLPSIAVWWSFLYAIGDALQKTMAEEGGGPL